MAKQAMTREDPATSPHEARLRHEKRVAASRARLEAINAKAARNHARGLHKALQRAAARFLPPGVELADPRVLDLIRWP